MENLLAVRPAMTGIYGDENGKAVVLDPQLAPYLPVVVQNFYEVCVLLPCRVFLGQLFQVLKSLDLACAAICDCAVVRASETAAGARPTGLAHMENLLALLRVCVDVDVEGSALTGIPRDVAMCRCIMYGIRMAETRGSLTATAVSYVVSVVLSSAKGACGSQAASIAQAFVAASPALALRLTLPHPSGIPMWEVAWGAFPLHASLLEFPRWLFLPPLVRRAATKLDFPTMDRLRVGQFSDDGKAVARMLFAIPTTGAVGVAAVLGANMHHAIIGAFLGTVSTVEDQHELLIELLGFLAAAAAAVAPHRAVTETLVRARLATLRGSLRMVANPQFERMLNMTKGSVEGDCAVCLCAVSRANYYVYPCLCQSMLHATCAAHCVVSAKGGVVKCPTCRQEFSKSDPRLAIQQEG